MIVSVFKSNLKMHTKVRRNANEISKCFIYNTHDISRKYFYNCSNTFVTYVFFYNRKIDFIHIRRIGNVESEGRYMFVTFEGN